MFKQLTIAAFTLALGLAGASAQDDSIIAIDDTSDLNATGGAELQLDDADLDTANGLDGGQMLTFGKGPLAYGTVNSNGAKVKGSTNWSSTYNSTYKRYEITITSNSYFYLNYATVITPAGDTRFCKSSSVGGKLLVYCYNHAGTVQPSRFGFLTFKP